MSDIFWFICVTLAVFRLGNLLSKDTITAGLRIFVGRLASGSPIWKYIAEWINCPYCNGVWFAIIGAVVLKPKTIIEFFIYWLSIAGGQYLLQSMISERQNNDQVY
jgi:hypothetical protein